MKKTLISSTLMALFASSSVAASIDGFENENKSFVADTNIMANLGGVESEANRYAGISASNSSVEIKQVVGATTSITGEDTLVGIDRLYGVVSSDKASLKVHGNLNINLKSEGTQIRVVRANNSNINLDNLKIVAETAKAAINGIEAWYGATVNINSADVSLIGGSNSGLIQGILNTQASMNFLGETRIHISSESDGGAFGVVTYGDRGANPSLVNFNGNTELNVSAKGVVFAVTVSGDDTVTFNSGTQNLIQAHSSGALAAAVETQYGGAVELKGETTIKASGKEAIGILNTNYAGTKGRVNATDFVQITVQGDDAFGIKSMTEFESKWPLIDDPKNTNIELTAGSKIVATSSSVNGQAVGVYGANTTFNEVTPTSKIILKDSTIIANNAAGQAFGVIATEDFNIALNGNSNIIAEGNQSTGLLINNASVSVNGIASIKGQDALVGDETALLNVQGESNQAGSLQLIGNIQNKGTINLTDSSLELFGSTEQVKLGVVNSVGSSESSVLLSGGDYLIDAYRGENKSLILNDLSTTKSVVIAEKSGSLNIVASANSNDQYQSAQDAANALLGVVDIEKDQSKDSNKLEVIAGSVNNGVTADIKTDASGNQILENYKETKNDKLDAFGSVTALSALTLRHEMNSLSKRMGELRDAPAGVGAWVRGYGSEMEYGAQNIKAKNNSIQVGSDYTLGDWKVGAAFSYTDGESSYDKGSADNKGYGVAVYGTWFVPCGAYIDLMAKYNRLDNDFALNGMNGSFDNDAFAVSVETGYRFDFMEGGVYVEPQVGLSYGHVKGETIKTSNGVTLEQDDYDSLIGRVGVRTGFKFPKDKGTIYARVSGVYDFDGEVNGTARKGESRNTFEADLGGAWLELGVGANFNWTKNTYTYIDFERTNGGDVKENYRWNIGVRHNF